MKEIRLLTYWQYGVNTKEFDELLKEMNVVFCGYLYEKKEDIRRGKIFDSIYLYNNIDFYEKNISFSYELDDEIITRMGSYEMAALDIINRWRRSITSKETYAELRKIYFIYLRYWYNYIKQNHINMLILNIMPHVPATFFPYAICKILNIPIIVQSVMPFTVGEKINYILQPDIECMDYNFGNRLQIENEKENLEDNLPQYLLRYFEQYTTKEFNKKRVIFYNEKKSVMKRVRAYIDRGKIYISRQDTKLLIGKVKNIIRIKLETGKILREIEGFEQEVDLSDSFYFYPLHLQPEATTLPNGGVFVNQMLVIRMVSKYLPEGTYLYVKEHPSYWMMKNRLESIRESRTKEFYEEILKLKNVKLIKHSQDSFDLMKRCKCLITVTGTAGFEAIFMGKPVLLFSNTFYKFYKNIYNIRKESDCCESIMEIEDGQENYLLDKKEMCGYLKALSKYVVPLGVNEKNFIDNGTPKVDKYDRKLINEKIIEFYREYYENNY